MILRILVLALLMIMPNVTSYAQIVTVEAEGTYTVGDGINENIGVAKELARREALRNASEKAGVYVQSYSSTKNNVLTEDEVSIVSSNILQIIKQECTPIVEGKTIKFIYYIKANVDTSNLNIQIERILSNKNILAKNIELEKRLSALEETNKTLKNKYNDATQESQKKLYQKLISQNEDNLITTFRYTERLPKCEMALGNITFGCTLGEIRNKYGNPQKRERFSSDGVIAIHYYYDNNLRVTGRVFAKWDKANRKYYSETPESEYPVTGFSIDNDSLTMPCGIKVGDSYLKVVENFGIGSKYEPYGEVDKVGFTYLLKATLEEMHFIVDKNGIICKIGTSTDF